MHRTVYASEIVYMCEYDDNDVDTIIDLLTQRNGVHRHDTPYNDTTIHVAC